MKIIVAAVLLSVVSTSANAQMTFSANPQPPTAFGTDPIIRVISSFRAPAALAEGQSIPDAKTQEAARLELYRSAERECTQLSEIYKAECRLSQVTINPVLAVPNASPPNALGATATYELRPKR